MVSNNKLAELFTKLSNQYLFIGPEQRFRAMAYANVAKSLILMKEPVCSCIHDPGILDSIKGVGKHLVEKIKEYCLTGKIGLLEELSAKLPADLIELTKISGIGPATIRSLHQFYHVSSRSELKKRLLENINYPKRVGRHKMLLIKKALQLNEKEPVGLKRQAILPLADEFKKFLEKLAHVKSVKVAGSLRRKKEWVGDIDLVVCCERKFMHELSQRMILYPKLHHVLVRGDTKVSVLLEPNLVQCDVRIIEPESLGAALLYFTGSKEHNIQLRTRAKKQGFKLNEYGLYKQGNEKIAGRTETEMYHALGIEFIPPEQRLGLHEIEQMTLLKGKSDIIW